MPYSSLNLLEKEMHDSPFQNLLSAFNFKPKCEVEVLVPAREYVRGKQLLRDVFELYGIREEPNVSDFILKIYLDLLDDVIVGGKRTNAQLAYDIDLLVEKFRKEEIKTGLKEKKPNVFVLEDELSPNVEKSLTISVRTEKGTILRGEILLDDLSDYMKHHISIEELMAFMYRKYIYFIKENGNDKELLRSIAVILEEK